MALTATVAEARDFIVRNLVLGPVDFESLQVGFGSARCPNFSRAVTELREEGVVQVVAIGHTRRRGLALVPD